MTASSAFTFAGYEPLARYMESLTEICPDCIFPIKYGKTNFENNVLEFLDLLLLYIQVSETSISLF